MRKLTSVIHPQALLREKLGITQEKLGEIVLKQLPSDRKSYSKGSMQKRISMWETGKGGLNPEEYTIIAGVLGISEDELCITTEHLPNAPCPTCSTTVTLEDMKYLTVVQEGLRQPLTIGLIVELLSRRTPIK